MHLRRAHDRTKAENTRKQKDAVILYDSVLERF
ncbi:hypothetical protein JOC86_004795 [Bacillus pakistanensis]|uniref:Uncharacterized protein n=1 Tax=Rossellomorea pakistanensis TaxID=992288 RepID=A0ABS2NK37_9BACI|nr:hypothetical protein [Bacillus pakistanensis]